ncbi:hypothetical protein DAPPUDRAFT_265193 [Daphnia pulex]|uniref:Uncharacterized protein n=1 Tax=Daphnia pulex TaxID=6669 RepID=E9HT12_DAPPU|nr:hypothetical protein DAPPUDRAFT_265193 [Daphnia pulex]|eukprot:EFX65122.1 hypothetical protein DAPPUDRAFT_265193 [Daphnia pulex]
MLGRISWFFSHLGGTCGSRSTLIILPRCRPPDRESGFQRSPELLKAIREFPAPTFVTKYLLLLGLHQLSFGKVLTCLLVVAVREEAPLLVTLFVTELSMTVLTQDNKFDPLTLSLRVKP